MCANVEQSTKLRLMWKQRNVPKCGIMEEREWNIWNGTNHGNNLCQAENCTAVQIIDDAFQKSRSVMLGLVPWLTYSVHHTLTERKLGRTVCVRMEVMCLWREVVALIDLESAHNRAHTYSKLTALQILHLVLGKVQVNRHTACVLSLSVHSGSHQYNCTTSNTLQGDCWRVKWTVGDCWYGFSL